MILGNEQRRIVAYLDGLYPGGHLRQAKVDAFPLAALGDDVRELQSPKGMLSAGGEELSLRDAVQSAMMSLRPLPPRQDQVSVRRDGAIPRSKRLLRHHPQ
ncbi:MAG: hypothetical protein FJZ87_07865 [Chloroflexi bacterium]|nr:hypothetical protein [Chloroflexota bacterium]